MQILSPNFCDFRVKKIFADFVQKNLCPIFYSNFLVFRELSLKVTFGTPTVLIRTTVSNSNSSPNKIFTSSVQLQETLKLK